jgi:O-glycosyl hydrolase
VLGKRRGKHAPRRSGSRRVAPPAATAQPAVRSARHASKTPLAKTQCTRTATTTGCIGRAEADLLPALAPGGTAQITGKVTSAATSKPIEGIEVCANGEYGYECALTGAGGVYDIAGLNPGEYRVSFYAPFESGLNYLFQWYKDAPSYETATPISLGPGGTASEISAALQAGGQITGKVTSAATSKPVEGIEVCADNSDDVAERCAETSSTGEYDVIGLATAPYKVEFVLPFNSGLNYLPQFYNGKLSYAEAETVSVTAGSATPKINASLAEGGKISGTVTNATTKATVAGIEVCAYNAETTGCGLTGAGGEYSIGGLTTASTYRVEFDPNYDPESNLNYLPQYYNDKSSYNEAEELPVTIGATTPKINAALQPGGQITGKVTNTSKTALGEVQVCASEYSGEYVYRCMTTNSSGEYSINGLTTGTYLVAFSSPKGPYASQYYNDKVSSFEATPVSVTTGAPTPNVNAVLQLGAEIKGVVTDATSAKAVAGIEVCAVLADIDASTECTETDEAGDYAFAKLGEGEYRVEFAPEYFYNDSNLNYLREYYDNKPTAAEADLVTLTPGSVASEINAQLHPGGEVSGIVIAAAGKADLEDISVCADEIGGEYIDHCAATNKNGEYTVPALPTGSYTVEFQSYTEQYATQFYNGMLSFEEATPVPVTAGETTTKINAVMALAGKIEGIVKNLDSKTPADDVEVCPLRTSGGSTDYCTDTDEKGEYSLGGLQAGEYKVEFAPYYYGELYATQYYNDKTTYAEGATLNVAAGETIGAINAEIREAGQITGTITDASTSKGIEGIEICSYGDTAADEYIDRCGTSGAGGAYKVTGLPTGEYYVSFTGDGRNYLAQYYNDKANSSEEEKVAVTTGEVTPHINAALQPGAEITGLVTTKGTKAPIGGITVCADPRTTGYGECGETNASGEYSIVALVTGEYYVYFSGEGRLNYIAQYYNGKSTYGESTSATATQGSTTPNINAVLEVGAEISGRVTVAKSKGPLANVSIEVQESNGTYVTSASTNSAGEYLAIGIPTGKVAVEFYSGYDEYRTQYYNNKETLPEATLVATTSEGHVTPAINAALVEYPPVLESDPTITGTPVEGRTLAEQHGTWKNAPSEYTYQWLRCNTEGYECTRLEGATQQTYKTVFGDVGHTLRVEETAHNEGGASSPATSEQTATVAIAPPENTKAPKITGIAQQGKTLVDEKGTWTNSPSTFVYTWLRCNGAGAECIALPGANSSTYVPVQQDVGHTLRVEETAENGAGPGAPAMSAATAEVVPPIPVNAAAPTITGTAQQGKQLTEHHGTWEYSPTEYKYQWLSCNKLGEGCLLIGGATEATYTPGRLEVGGTLRAEEAAKNAGGLSGYVMSAPTAEVLPAPPVNISPPRIAGTAQQGKKLTEEHGTWENELTGYKYEWLSCNKEGDECSAIKGASEQTYTATEADVGHTLKVSEFAENKGGKSAPAMSTTSAVVVPPVPVNKTPPTITGTAKQGKELTVHHGTWEYAPESYEDKWLRCNTKGESCETIGATGETYKLDTADVGHTIRVEEIATNTGGSSIAAMSVATAVVANAAPENETPPTITGTAQQGKELTLLHGAWSNEPTGYEDKWLRCNEAGGECSAISAAKGNSYMAGKEDVGHTIRVEEKAHNEGGTSAATDSAQTAVVLPAAPVDITKPTITGEPVQGRTLTEHHGSYENSPTGYKLHWLQCNSLGASCLPISGAEGETYKPTSLDLGHTIRVEEIVTNSGGSSEPATSEPTAAVTAAVPVNITAPSVAGTAEKGQTLVEVHGTWTNEPTSYQYQWLRCSEEGTECKALGGFVDPTYPLTAADVGHTLEVQEVAVNKAGESAASTSSPSPVVQPIPLHAVAGESTSATVGVAVTFDGSGSTPAAEISKYKWEFGDGIVAEGESVSHSYGSPGTYTATLTVARGGESASATATVTVAPAPTHTASIEVTDASHNPLSGATVLYVGPGNVRIEGVTGGEGKASLAGLPDGTDTVYAYRGGFQPAAGQAVISGGAGETTIALSSGEVVASTLRSHEMTLKEIEEAGINTEDAENENVYEFEVQLAFPGYPESPSVELHCYINHHGEFVGDCHGGGGGFIGWGVGGPSCSPDACVGGGIAVTPEIVEGQPLIQWLVLRGKASVLKQFFEVSQVVQNLSPEPFKLAAGTATLNVPPGMSLAPTTTPQSATQAVSAIPGNGSAETNWIVRGDKPGEYFLSANYRSKLEPFEAPVEIEARLATPLKVWGVEALSLKVQADEGFLAEGRPYNVRIGVTNKANIPLYNVNVDIALNVHERFIFQPDQEAAHGVSELKPGETVYAPQDILVPDAASAGAFNPEDSSAHFVGEEIHPGVGIEAVSPPPLYELTARTETLGQVHLHWQPPPGAEGYEVFETPNLDTAFAEAPNEVFASPAAKTGVTELPPSATDAYLHEEGTDEFFAVTSIIDGRAVLNHTVITAAPPEEVAEHPFEVSYGGHHFKGSLPGNSVATYTWNPSGSSVAWWKTAGSGGSLTSAVHGEPAIPLENGHSTLPTIKVTSKAETNQTMEGFGAALTDSSAYLIKNAPQPEKGEVIHDLFSEEGAHFNIVRVPIGASDFVSNTPLPPKCQATPDLKRCYDPSKKCDLPTPTPPKETHCFEAYDEMDGKKTPFSIKHDEESIIPTLEEAQKDVAGLKILATPWSAPGLMKAGGHFITECKGNENSLQPESQNELTYVNYATYLAEAAKAYAAKHLPFSVLSLQNEPHNCTAFDPTMRMNEVEEATLSRVIGTEFKRLGVARPALLGWDHNWKEEQVINCKTEAQSGPAAVFPHNVLALPNLITDIGYHSYCGYPYLPGLKKAIGIWVTESTGTYNGVNGDTGANLNYEIKHEIMDPIRDGAKTSLYWNLVLDQGCGPQFDGKARCGTSKNKQEAGCPNCRPMITLDDERAAKGEPGAVTINEDLYYWEQFSKFVAPGSVRIGSSIVGELDSVAFRNPATGEITLVVLNEAKAKKAAAAAARVTSAAQRRRTTRRRTGRG